MEDLLPEFLAETLESLLQLDTELVTLERQPDDSKTLSSIFRHVHTIKGTCGFLGLARLEKVGHAAENVLGRHREGSLAVTPGSITLILQAVDCIRAIVETIGRTGHEPPGDDAELIARLNAVMADPGPGAPAQRAPVADDPAPAAMPAAAAPSAPPEPASATIRVNVDVLEGLMTLVSELVLTRNQILQLARSQTNDTFAGPLQRLSHITSDLQEGVMKTRMQPIGNAWNNLPRLVRDLASDLGKKIELTMTGADTELDRQVLEMIKDPLTHIVRNSADHGLETPAGRREAGKSEAGCIRLAAFHEGGHIVIEVSDDGRGLPVERIRAKIIANGLASEAELAGMSSQQIQGFIFRPGFSTAAAVTAVSGRGVGMDVVKTNIERIGGTIDLASEPGAGTRFTMKIPLTLAIVSALIVDVAGERFAVPQTGVVELVCAQPAGTLAAWEDPERREQPRPEVEYINDTPVMRLRDQLLPLVHLGRLLRLCEPEAAALAPARSVYVVVVQVGATRFGLIVDRVFDTEEIVVKPVAPVLRHIPVFSGNTILGDGSVIMILDPNGIARATGIGSRRDGAALSTAPVTAVEGSMHKLALLLFKAGDATLKAVPLNLVSRLESVPQSAIEYASGQPMSQYRGRLMPLVAVSGSRDRTAAALQPVLVFTDHNRVMGLMVDEIIDVVEDHLQVELASEQPGFLGTAIVQGRATDILDASFWLKTAFPNWFGRQPAANDPPRRVLVVEDSAFFRSLIVPVLAGEGMVVTAVEHPVAALALRQAGRAFELILSDIEMPEMDGLSFVREIRAGGAWATLPVLALTSRSTANDQAAGQQAGFDGYISKFDKEVLLSAVRTALAQGHVGATRAAPLARVAAE